MARSMTHRIKDWRNRKADLGGKSLTVMLEPDTVILLEDLKEKYQESNAKLVARALGCLADSFTCKHSDRSIKDAFGSNHVSAEKSDSASADGIHPSLKNIKEELGRGAAVLSLKEKIKKAMREMRNQGFDSSKIVDLLYEASIKTIKGNDRWEGGTVRKWWK